MRGLVEVIVLLAASRLPLDEKIREERLEAAAMLRAESIWCAELLSHYSIAPSLSSLTA